MKFPSLFLGHIQQTYYGKTVKNLYSVFGHVCISQQKYNTLQHQFNPGDMCLSSSNKTVSSLL